jgi:ribosomal protein L11 methyltransferase
MNNASAESVKAYPCPYDDLFIYYLQGRIRAGGPALEGLIGNWEEEDTTFLFFSAPAREQVGRLLAVQPQLTLVDHYEMSYDQWQGDTLKPFDIGRFRISPPWQPAAPENDRQASKLPLILDPGVVFGTGTHPTTHDCLAALELACAEAAPRDVLDLGTGTGLLALAAALLGARPVLAVDLNLLAVRTAHRNVALNGLENQVMAVQGRAEDFIDMPADLVIANIHFDVMQVLIDTPAFPGGRRFILSGLLRSEARHVETRLLQTGARIHRKWAHEGTWYTFYGHAAAT